MFAPFELFPARADDFDEAVEGVLIGQSRKPAENEPYGFGVSCEVDSSGLEDRADPIIGRHLISSWTRECSSVHNVKR